MIFARVTLHRWGVLTWWRLWLGLRWVVVLARYVEIPSRGAVGRSIPLLTAQFVESRT